MTETKWTPGPHRVVFGVGDWGMPTSHYILRPGAKDEYDPNGRIALLLSIQPYCAGSSLDQLAVEQRANAQLYAAAPDLYASVERLLLEFDFMVERGVIPDVRDDIIFDNARAAMRKARGSDDETER